MSRASSHTPITGLLLAGIAAVACGFTLLKHSEEGNDSTHTASVYILGPARSLLANGLYERADLYFHKGAARDREEAFESVFHKWKRAITPDLHAHAEGREVEEMLPWLRLATKSDPHNIEIYLVASYWLNGECGRADLAKEAISEAMETNPDRYELHQEMARLHLSDSQYTNALSSLGTAWRIMGAHAPEDPEQAAIDLKFNVLAQSYILEALNENDQCLRMTRELVKLNPTTANRDRLELIEIGDLDPDAAEHLLQRLFAKDHSCDRDEHEHGPDCGCAEPDQQEHVHGPNCQH